MRGLYAGIRSGSQTLDMAHWRADEAAAMRVADAHAGVGRQSQNSLPRATTRFSFPGAQTALRFRLPMTDDAKPFTRMKAGIYTNGTWNVSGYAIDDTWEAYYRVTPRNWE